MWIFLICVLVLINAVVIHVVLWLTMLQNNYSTHVHLYVLFRRQLPFKRNSVKTKKKIQIFRPHNHIHVFQFKFILIWVKTIRFLIYFSLTFVIVQIVVDDIQFFRLLLQ
jgi:hypothetical protein